MKTIVELIKKNSDWLYVKIFENPIFFFDYWSFVHLWSGGVLITIISSAKLKHKWLLLFAILLFYEIIEASVVFSALNIFKPETIKDQFTDIVVGMAGGYLFDKWLNFYSSDKKQFSNILQNPNTHIALFTAFTIAFIWVGFYGYEYNVLILNSQGLNYTAFLIWSLGIFSILVIYNQLSIRFKKVYSICLLWIIYIIWLCIFEFTFYYIVGFKESGKHDHNPLIFGIIHGTIALHIFYLSIPFISVALYSLFNKFFKVAFFNVRKFNEYLNLIKRYNTIVRYEIPYKPTPALRIGNKIKKYFNTNKYGGD